jgi:lactate dehydrogenase-like 2-hydroxyacid dehydrogenase
LLAELKSQFPVSLFTDPIPLPSTYFAQDIYGKRLGLIGFGRIGQAVARRGYHGFGMDILYHSRSLGFPVISIKLSR